MDLKAVDEVYDNSYFRINKILNIWTGLWPFRPAGDKLIRRCIVMIVLGSVTVPHVNGIRIWCGVQLGLCAENISGVVYAAGIFTKYVVACKSEDKIIKVYRQVAENWLTLTDPAERKILIKFTNLGKLKTFGYIGYLIIAGICFSQLGMLPLLFDVFIPLNESRKKLLPVQAEFFVDPFKYFFHIYFIYCILTVVSVTVLMSIDTMYTVVVHQILGVFNIVKYRLQISSKISSDGSDYAYDTIVSAIRLHKKSLQFIEIIESTYENLFLILICICVLFLTFGAITIMERANETLDFIRLSLIEFGVMIHLFYLTWPGQLVISESSELFEYTYMNEWYITSKRAKTLLTIMMMRCIKPCNLTAAGLYIMNFENYGSIIKTTMSYITVLASFRN